jgi:two-component system phosphate regulon response regulator PhoB
MSAKTTPVSRRVLLIDDTPEIAELLSYALRDRGFDVVTSSYTTGIGDLVASQAVDAVVLDCSMYDMSESLLDALRDDARHTERPVVVITDTPDAAVASLRARRARRVRLVAKPFTATEVATALDRFFGAAGAVDRS